MQVLTVNYGRVQVKATSIQTIHNQVLLMDGQKLVAGFPLKEVTTITKHGEAIFTRDMEMEA